MRHVFFFNKFYSIKNVIHTFFSVALSLGRDGKIYLRSAEGLEDWFELLEECMFTSKERRKALRYSQNDNNKPRDNNNVPSLDEWVTSRQKIGKIC